MADSNNKYAVLIGINDYHESLGPLNYCVNDTKLLRETLTSEQCGFEPDNVLMLTEDQSREHQPTFGNIHSWLGTWLQRPGPDDLVLVYFAGHGREYKGSGFLAPCDATLESLGVTGIPIQYIREMLERCNADRKVLMLDACHSGAGRDVAPMTAAFKDELEDGRGLYTIASCDAEQISHEWPAKGQGVFTFFLAEAIKESAPAEADGRVTLDGVYNATRERVLEWSRSKRIKQEPVRICRGSGSFGIAQRRLTTEERLKRAENEMSRLKDELAEKDKKIQQLQKKAEQAGKEADESLKKELETLKAETIVRKDARGFLEKHGGSKAKWRSFVTEAASKYPVLSDRKDDIKRVLDEEAGLGKSSGKQFSPKKADLPEWKKWLKASDYNKDFDIGGLYLFAIALGSPGAGLVAGRLFAYSIFEISEPISLFIGLLAALIFGPGLAGFIHWRWLEHYRNRYRLECAESCMKVNDINGGSSFALAMGKAGVDKSTGSRLLISLAEVAKEQEYMNMARVLLERAWKYWGSPHAKRMFEEME